MRWNWFSWSKDLAYLLQQRDRALVEWLSTARRLLGATAELHGLYRRIRYPPPPRKRTIMATNAPGPQVPIYLVSSRFLAECYKALFYPRDGETERYRDAAEVVFPITGVRFGPVLIWDAFIPTPMLQRSSVTAVIDSRDLSRVLRELDHYAHALYGFVHSHRHKGAPHPSSTDMALQRILEGAKYPAIQAVFSESRHIRFFADQRQFEVMIYGSGIERLDYRLFRLIDPPEVAP